MTTLVWPSLCVSNLIPQSCATITDFRVSPPEWLRPTPSCTLPGPGYPEGAAGGDRWFLGDLEVTVGWKSERSLSWVHQASTLLLGPGVWHVGTLEPCGSRALPLSALCGPCAPSSRVGRRHLSQPRTPGWRCVALWSVRPCIGPETPAAGCSPVTAAQAPSPGHALPPLSLNGAFYGGPDNGSCCLGSRPTASDRGLRPGTRSLWSRPLALSPLPKEEDAWLCQAGTRQAAPPRPLS
jgi:hypothetical protein